MNKERTPFRILFMNSGKGLGGPTSFLYSLLTCLDYEQFIPVVAFYFPDTGPDIQRIKDLGVPVHFLSRKKDPYDPDSVQPRVRRIMPGMLRKAINFLKVLVKIVTMDIPAGLRLYRLIRREKIDAVVLNNDVHYHLGGVLGTKLAGIPCICRKAGGIGEGRRYKKFLTPLISIFIAVSRATEEDQRTNNPGTRRLVTVHEGINLDFFESRAARNSGIREELGIPPSGKVVVSISRLAPGKGHRELLNAAAAIADTERDAVFLIVGDGQTGDELKAQARSMYLAERVIFTGWRTDIREVLSIADIFVHCPTTFLEGLGIANLEAMAMGIPTIVSENGGLPDAVVDGVTGYVVSPGDERAMADAIAKLIDDEQLACRLGKNARKRVEERFDIRKNVRRLEMLITEVVESHRVAKREAKRPSVSTDSTSFENGWEHPTQIVCTRQRPRHSRMHAQLR